MFEDFIALNYYKTPNKIKKNWEMVNRLFGNYDFKLAKIKQIEKSLDNISKEINKVNKELEEESVAGVVADLIISSIDYELQDTVIVFYVTIKNIGTAKAKASIANTILGYNDTNTSTPALEPNESYTFAVCQGFDQYGDEIEYTITAIADKFNQVEESDESNNTKSKTVTAKKTTSGKAYIIVHCHNPEGFEINSITGINGVNIYVDGYWVRYGANDVSSHYIPIEIIAGDDVEVKVSFNNFNLTQVVNLKDGETKQLFFTFSRTELNLNSISQHMEIEGNCESCYMIYDKYTPSNAILRMHLDGEMWSEGYFIGGNIYTRAEYTLDKTSFHCEFEVHLHKSDISVGGYARSESYSGGNPLQLSYSYPILPSSFNWYSQYYITGAFPSIWSIIGATGSHAVSYYSADNIDTIDFNFSWNWCSNSARCDLVEGQEDLDCSDFKSCDGIIHYWHMSTIPYNMDSKAI